MTHTKQAENALESALAELAQAQQAALIDDKAIDRVARAQAAVHVAGLRVERARALDEEQALADVLAELEESYTTRKELHARLHELMPKVDAARAAYEELANAERLLRAKAQAVQETPLTLTNGLPKPMMAAYAARWKALQAAHDAYTIAAERPAR